MPGANFDTQWIAAPMHDLPAVIKKVFSVLTGWSVVCLVAAFVELVRGARSSN